MDALINVFKLMYKSYYDMLWICLMSRFLNPTDQYFTTFCFSICIVFGGNIFTSTKKNKKQKQILKVSPFISLSGAGILAMANAGPDTNGSQFFLTLAPTQWLDGKHTIFGRVFEGMGVLNRIGMVETNSQDRPVDDIKIVRTNVID